MSKFLILPLLFVASYSWGQHSIKTIRIAKELKEISGLEQYNDSILIAINDSGNSPFLYFVDLKGVIVKKTLVDGVKNRDWEDLAQDDKGNLYIGDVGNNDNKKHKLHIHKLKLEDAFQNDTVWAQTIEFSYADQKEYPPAPGERIFDCEAIAWEDGHIRLVTKNTDKWAIESWVYHVPDSAGSYKITKHDILYSKPKIKEQITSIDIFDSKTIYLTYGALSIGEKEIKFHHLTQKEAVLKLNDGRILVASEGQFLLGGPFFHFVTLE